MGECMCMRAHICTHTLPRGNFKNYVQAKWRRKTSVLGVGGFAEHQPQKV